MAAPPLPAPPHRGAPPLWIRRGRRSLHRRRWLGFIAERRLLPSGSGEDRGCRAGGAPPPCLPVRVPLLSLAPSSAGAGAAAGRRPAGPSPPDLMVRPPRLLVDLDRKDGHAPMLKKGELLVPMSLARSLRELRRTPLAFCAGEHPLRFVQENTRCPKSPEKSANPWSKRYRTGVLDLEEHMAVKAFKHLAC